MEKISTFRGPYGYLSNMHTCKIVHEGIEYRSVECAYQASKTNALDLKLAISKMSPVESKRFGRGLCIISDWDTKKLEIMEELVRYKFTHNRILREQLIETFPIEIEEHNNWRDNFWGIYRGYGENHLGKIIMKIRDELIEAKNLL